MTLLLANLARTLKTQATVAGQRRLLVLSGEHGWCQTQARSLLTSLAPPNPLWIGDSAPMGITRITNQTAISRLGSEIETLVYDAHAGFDPDAFGALCGTLQGGGLLILMTPPLEDWPAFTDPEHARIVVAGTPACAVSGRFLHRLVRLIRDDPGVTRVAQGGDLPEPPADTPIPAPIEPMDEICRTRDQRLAVTAVIHVVTGHRRRPVVLISDRGRGKSAALGIAAARLLESGRNTILVTAPRLAATRSLFDQAARLLPQAQPGKGALHLGSSSISYSAPDHLVQQPRPADLLLVDEAAAIPAPLLEALLEHYPRIAFATTVHGYEGTGRGFALRFRGVLERRFPQWREIRLETPIRWAPDDPLERWLFSALALDAAPVADELIAPAQAEACRLEVLDRDRLVDNEPDLRDLFGLLVLAHYRTTPFDLRQILDGPNLSLFVLRYRERILATALVAEEGGFDAPTAHAIWSGYRRPRGHLLAQSLAAHIGLEAGAGLRGARIMRIAVHPAVQQRGLGSLLVQKVLEYARNSGLDYLGSSFGATAELIGFWARQRLLPIRVGLRRGASSGTQSVIVLHPLSAAGNEIFQLARQRFSRQFPGLLSDPLKRMDPVLGCALLARSSPPQTPPLDALDWLDLIGFAFAERGFEGCLPALETLTLWALCESRLKTRPAVLMLMRVLQKRDWQTCAAAYGLAGRRALEERLRSLVGELVLHYADANTRELALRIQAEAEE